jgi:hypothetical protein
MFTLGALVLAILTGWWAERKNEQDRSQSDLAAQTGEDWLLRLHIRQDLKLIAFLLASILVMLGVIADRIR